ncbi:hypothetical protein CTH30272_03069 [Allocatenococcus thiocycli]|nr:hypothetical protein CTH30272_03069 [Catenococcus thiocycli]
MNNTGIRAFCTTILAASAITSAYLTVTFMFSLGTAAGLGAVFGVSGLILDITKTFAPSLMSRLVSKNMITTLLLGSLTLTLMGISTAASIFSLQNGVNNALRTSNAAQIASKKASNLEAEIKSLNELKTKQLSINFVTKADATQKLINTKNSELNALLDQTNGANDDSFLAKFSTEIVFIIAISLEIISAMMTLCLHNLKTTMYYTGNTHEAELDTNRQYPSKTPISQGETAETLDKLSTKNSKNTGQGETTLITPDKEIVFAAKVREQILEELKCAVVAGLCKPTHREIRQKFGSMIKQREIKNYLEALAERNVLVATDNGSFRLT